MLTLPLATPSAHFRGGTWPSLQRSHLSATAPAWARPLGELHPSGDPIKPTCTCTPHSHSPPKGSLTHSTPYPAACSVWLHVSPDAPSAYVSFSLPGGLISYAACARLLRAASKEHRYPKGSWVGVKVPTPSADLQAVSTKFAREYASPYRVVDVLPNGV